MFRTGMLACLVMALLVATTFETVVAAEPVGAPPPAKSIREWNPNPTAAPAANPAAPPPAKSIREWNPNPTAAPATSPCSMASVGPAAMPAVGAAVPASPLTISLTSTLREGNLVILIDDVPIFNESFRKPVLLISQTTTWDPVQIPAGQHRLAAKVYGTKKTYLSALYDLTVSHTKASALRFVMKGDKLTVQVAS
jgi:hypothetical protein